MGQYLDQNGNPIPAQPVYLDPNTGEPLPSQAPPRASNDFIDTLSGTAPWQKAIDAAAQTEPYSADKGVLGNAKTAADNLGAGATQLMLEPLAHPVKTVENLVSGLLPKMPTPDQGTMSPTGYTPPPAAPIPWGQTGGQLTAAVPGAALAAVGAKPAAEAAEAPLQAVTNGIEKAKQWASPASSPSIVPRTELASRNLAAVILPPNKDAANFIQAAQKEVPNIIDYAKRTGNPLNTQLEFSKAAQGYAQEVREVYQNSVLGPSANKLVRTTGTGFGRQMGEGPDTYATLGEIDKRIGDINTQLDAPAMNADDARRALASKTELQAEAAGLRDILHRNLSQATGLTPEQIGDIRQRVGRSYELANDTDAAVTQRMQGAGKADQAPLVPMQIPSQVFRWVQGGRTAIADRGFQRAIRNFPGQSQSLPAINPSPDAPEAPLRPSLSQSAGIQAEPNPLQAVPMAPDAAQARVAAMNRILQLRKIAIENEAEAQQRVAAGRAAREQELLARARQLQDAARGGRQ